MREHLVGQLRVDGPDEVSNAATSGISVPRVIRKPSLPFSPVMSGTLMLPAGAVHRQRVVRDDPPSTLGDQTEAAPAETEDSEEQ